MIENVPAPYPLPKEGVGGGDYVRTSVGLMGSFATLRMSARARAPVLIPRRSRADPVDLRTSVLRARFSRPFGARNEETGFRWSNGILRYAQDERAGR